MPAEDPDLQALARSLRRLGGTGGFAAMHHEPAVGLSIDVDGVGRCDFPLSPERIAALIERAVPSPFGYRDETRHDPAVRDSWEIDGAAVHVDARQWSARFERGIAAIATGLGLPADDLRPTLHKLLVYAPGQFFTRHRDSERSPSMVGTLVVALPSAYRGGDVVVSHAGQTVTLATDKSGRTHHVSFLGFYADCVHETRPVEDGYRVALSYALDTAAADVPVAPISGGEDLQQSLRTFFLDADADDDDEPLRPWLVVLLDHQYSEQSVGWSRLKGADKLRAPALREAAAALHCDCFLALADVHEAYEYDEGDDEGDDEDDFILEPDDEEPDDAPFVSSPDADDPLEQLTQHTSPRATVSGADISLGRALLGRELTLDHWRDGDDRPCAGTDEMVDDDCIVSPLPSHGRPAYETHCEPWTGNEGGTADKWYHQTAIVIVPRRGELHEEIVGPVEESEGPPTPSPARASKVQVRKRRRSP